MTDRRIVRRADLLLQGATDREIRRATSGLARLTPGAFAPLDGLSAEQTHLLRAHAVVESRPTVVASHTTAALAYGLPVPAATLERVHVSPVTSKRGHAKSSTSVRMHSRVVELEEIHLASGLRVTGPLRTVLDSPQVTDLDWAVAIADAAVHAGLVDLDALRALGAEVRGIRAAERIRSMAGLASRHSESTGESLLRLRLRRMGWDPTEQVELPWVIGRPRVDFLIEGRLVVEFDGMAKYELQGDVARAHQREKQRNEHLAEAGYEVMHVIWAQLWDEMMLRRRLALGLERARRRPMPVRAVG